MHPPRTLPDRPLLVLPDAGAGPTSIRAKALLFNDPRSARLLDEMQRLVATQACALVVGQTGTGKELIGRHIHRIGGGTGAFVMAHCGALDPAYTERALFGDTGDTGDTGDASGCGGWLQAAQGGTLYLDEVGDLPRGLQARLLAWLQQHAGAGASAAGTRLRLVAATSIDLQAAVASGRFDAGLHAQLANVTLVLPPLRERPGDILPLARHFLGLYAGRLGLPRPVALTAQAEQALLEHAWPGNIRELDSVMHFALMVCRNDRVDAADLRLPGTAASGPFVAGAATARPPTTPRPPATAPLPAPTSLLQRGLRWLGLGLSRA